MANSNIKQKSYFELAEHNTLQVFVFALLMAMFLVILFGILLPGLEKFFSGFLNGRVFNSGIAISSTLESLLPKKTTHYLFSWAVDIYLKTPQEARYWFNPILSLIIPLLMISIGLTIIISSLLPRTIGYMRQKIEREIVNNLDKISLSKHGFHNEGSNDELADEIIHSDLRDLYNFSEQWGIPIEDLKVLQKALMWRKGSTSYKVFHFNDGISMYMRSYFTMKYNNAVLGFVYIGAAVLIIIIGLRGLKFIPPTQPSLVIFALGLEFSLLITYAITLMYSKQDEESESDYARKKQPDSLLNSNNFGSSKEIENLLRVFIKKSDAISKKGKGSSAKGD